MGRGGKRPGAGPPRVLDDPKKVTIIIDAETEAKIVAWQQALRLNRSQAIRRLLRAAPLPDQEGP